MTYQQQKNEFKIYTLNDCVYCFLAKQLLESKKIKYQEIKMECDLNLFDEMKKKYKYDTVPLIFINKKFIGGYTQLKEILDKKST